MLVSLMLVAGSAMAMKAISNDEMDSITGQAGVSIIVDDVKLYAHIGGLWYTDTDGINGQLGAFGNGTVGGNALWNLTYNSTAPGASVGVKDLEVLVHVNSITKVDNSTGSVEVHSPGRSSQGNYGTLQMQDFYNFARGGAGKPDDVFLAKPLTIDVTEKLPVMSEGAAYDNTQLGGGLNTNFSGVMIELGTIELFVDKMKIDVGINDTTPLDGTDTLSSINGHSYGTVFVGKTTLLVLDGEIEIAPH